MIISFYLLTTPQVSVPSLPPDSTKTCCFSNMCYLLSFRRVRQKCVRFYCFFFFNFLVLVNELSEFDTAGYGQFIYGVKKIAEIFFFVSLPKTFGRLLNGIYNSFIHVLQWEVMVMSFSKSNCNILCQVNFFYGSSIN